MRACGVHRKCRPGRTDAPVVRWRNADRNRSRAVGTSCRTSAAASEPDGSVRPTARPLVDDSLTSAPLADMLGIALS